MITGKAIADGAMELLQHSIPYKPGGESMSGMDCQGLVEYVIRQLGMKASWKGSNAMYRACTWTGTPEECKRIHGSIPQGALLFILTNDGGEVSKGYSDGKGNASHVGVYTAQGDGAVHASSSRGCVCSSRFKGKTIPNGGWNRIGLLPGISYGLGGDGMEEKDTSIAVATVSTEGGPLNLRVKANGALLDRIPDGETITVLEKKGNWCRVQWKSLIGYVATAYLAFETGSETGDLIQVSKNELQEIYDRLGGLLGLRG